ncbi:MAG: hypothetical protein AABY84_03525 [Candidatus Firestonebacteria bacterium]
MIKILILLLVFCFSRGIAGAEEWLFNEEKDKKSLICYSDNKPIEMNIESNFQATGGAEDNGGCIKVDIISVSLRSDGRQVYVIVNDIKKDKKYKLQMWLRGSDDLEVQQITLQAVLPWKRIDGGKYGETKISVTTKWQKFEKEFVATDDAPSEGCRVILLAGGENMSGKTIWIDNIVFMQID